MRVLTHACNNAACPAAWHLAHFVQNLIGLDRLDHVKVETSVARTLPIFVFAPAGNGDEHHAVHSGLAAQPACQLEAIDAG